MKTFHKALLQGALCILLAFALFVVTDHWLQSASPGTAFAQGGVNPTPTSNDSLMGEEGGGDEEPLDNEACLRCHESPYLQLALPSGETVSVTVDAEQYAASVHGQHGPNGYRCIRCHPDLTETYPHPDISLSDGRELTISLSTGCSRCHPAKFDEVADSVHNLALSNGNRDAAVCADCHSGHNVERLTDEMTGDLLPDAHLETARMCQQCHSEIYERYSQSVHGAALIEEGNLDTPTCIDCHGVHNVQGPSSTNFRLESPQICAKCHADAGLMERYNVSTEVFNTYVSDFHGTTVMLFQEVAPDQDVNSPACVDCHGVHNIQETDNPENPVIKENLLSTCQRCHPDANSNFPSAWLSHYQPSFEKTPLVATVNLAYGILIPTVIAGMVTFVLSDVARRRFNHSNLKSRIRWPRMFVRPKRVAPGEENTSAIEAKELSVDPSDPSPGEGESTPPKDATRTDNPEEMS